VGSSDFRFRTKSLSKRTLFIGNHRYVCFSKNYKLFGVFYRINRKRKKMAMLEGAKNDWSLRTSACVLLKKIYFRIFYAAMPTFFYTIDVVTDDGFSLSNEQQLHTTNKPILAVQNIPYNYIKHSKRRAKVVNWADFIHKPGCGKRTSYGYNRLHVEKKRSLTVIWYKITYVNLMILFKW